MVEAGIIRSPTPEEKKNFQEIGVETYRDKFRKKLIEKEQEYVKKHKPFCFRCAKLDFEDSVERRLKEVDRIVDSDIKLSSVWKGDLDKYGSPDRFKKIEVKEVYEDKLLDGIRTRVLIGYNVYYKCIRRGCKVIVFKPKEDKKDGGNS